MSDTTPGGWAPFQSSFRRLAGRVVDYPPVRSALRSAMQMAPVSVQNWLRNERLKMKISDGFRLVPTAELARIHRKIVQWLLAGREPQTIGDYVEFGVFFGSSLATMHHVLDEFGLRHVRLFGFDSFEGLPDIAAVDDEGFWKPGYLRMTQKNAEKYLTREGVDWQRVVLTKGWFCDTLTPELVARHRIEKASIIMVDCTLYSSARDALNFCAPLIKDRAVILFDDWFAGDLAEKNLGEKKAFAEFLAAHPELEAEDLGDTYFQLAKVFKVVRRDRGNASAGTPLAG